MERAYRIRVCRECGAPATVNWSAKIWAPTCDCQEACDCSSSLLMDVDLRADLEPMFEQQRAARDAEVAAQIAEHEQRVAAAALPPA